MAQNKAKNQSAKPAGTVSILDEPIQVHFTVPIEMPSVFASNVLIQPLEHEVLVSFYEVQPPLLFGKTEEANIQTLRKVGLRADCVARVTIAKQRFDGFANAMYKVAQELKAAEKKKNG